MYFKIPKTMLVFFLSFVLMIIPTFSHASDGNLRKEVNINLNKALYNAKLAEEIAIKNKIEIKALSTINVKREALLDSASLFFKTIENRPFEELTAHEKETLVEITQSSRNLVEQLIGTNKVEDRMISPMYTESTLSKAIEAAVVGLDTNLSVSNITTAFNNADTAREIGKTYAQLMGWGTTTWDNPADAYRHFSWNWFNARDMGVNKARLFGDYHELSLAAAQYVSDNYPSSLGITVLTTLGVQQVYTIHTDTRASLANFNSQWDNASVMDIYNNSWGRKYYQNYSYTKVADAFYDAMYVDNNIIGYVNEVNSSKRSIAYSYWK